MTADGASCPGCNRPITTLQETNAHNTNGKICQECGHLYGPPNCKETLLIHYCQTKQWDDAILRLHDWPYEASHVGEKNATALALAIQGEAPLSLIQALAEAFPNAVTTEWTFHGDAESPFWFAMTNLASNRKLGHCKILVSANNNVLRTGYWNGIYYVRSPIAYFSYEFQRLMKNAGLAQHSCTVKELLERGGSLGSTFHILSLLIKAEYHGKLDDPIVGSSLLHSIAGCRDPFFPEQPLLSIVLRSSQEQFLEVDQIGRCPLHIAASTRNHDKANYLSNQPNGDLIACSNRRDQFYQFMYSFCPHGCPHLYRNFEEYMKCKPGFQHNCCCRQRLLRKDKDGKAYSETEHPSCDCRNRFEQAKRDCRCEKAFDYYYDKMTDEHRNDKMDVIQVLIEACPRAAAIPDQAGSLPIHLAIASGKCWDAGVKAIVQAYPDAVGIKDPVTKLYPFMAAASANDLDTSLDLLRLRPDVLNWGTSQG
ncbi:expressed unknown protein [Seminavis robusta]|uniref:Uncharacterized protein n=1 Tax=Seminavis robusta TaxID=568900 RepID=A0A9N8EP72_9STRA|nr:expressed unknown protein [Seminavis robusta]|eukprot:Sro1436_g272440.1 n/a (481) ;mRNA; f:13351-14793